MEEKLYFKPEGPAKEKKRGKKSHKVLRLVCFLLFFLIIVLIIIWLLRGKTTKTTEKIPNIETESVYCSSDSFTYPLFRYDEAKSRNLEVKMVFSEEKLKTITLEYSLFYNSKELIEASEAHNHAEMNINFAKSGLNPDSYNAKYTILSDQMRMSLYANSSNFDETAKLYFLIKTEGDFPTDESTLSRNYESQGFTCKKQNN